MPSPRRDRARLREALWVLTLGSLLTTGALGVLALNTSMQQQSVRLSHQQQTVEQLTSQVQSLVTKAQYDADPRLLARRAERLGMRQATDVIWHGHVIGRAPAAPSHHGD
jgi:hypothetical protein